MARIYPVLLRSARFGWAFVFVSLLFVIPADAGVVAGDPVEPFSLEKDGGGTFHFPADAVGKVVFLNFWASWCPECKIELPELVQIWKKYEDRPFVLLAVNVDRKRKAADKFLKKIKLEMVVLYDNDQKTINTFTPVGIPASYLIGPTGKVEKVYVGFKKGYIEMYKKDIEPLLGETEATVPPAQTTQEVSTP